jgi:hypothetical protein
VGAGALLVEGRDLSDAVLGALVDLVAVVGAVCGIELDIYVVAGLALGRHLAAGGLDEGESTAVVVRGIVAASHEDDYIGAGGVQLGGSGALGGDEGRESAKGEGVADERHD